MYTKLEDQSVANKILVYMAENTEATIDNIITHCHINFHRLKKLEAEGYVTLPEPTPRGLRNKKYYEDKAIQQASS